MRRYIPSGLIPLLCSILLANASTSDEPKDSDPCSVYNPSNGITYDLTTITAHPLESHKKTHKDDRAESWHARGWDYGSNFTINFCAPVIESLDTVEGIEDDLVKNVSAFYRKGDKTYSIGYVDSEGCHCCANRDRQSSTAPLFRGRKLTLNYTDGSPCDSNPKLLSTRRKHEDDENDDDDDDDDHKHRAKPDPRRKSTLISFLCDRDSLTPKAHLSFIGASPDECTYFFEARSLAACGRITPTQQSMSPGGVFAVIVLITAAVYLLGGIAYQRTVMHQRGWRQLPNYSLWAGIFGFLNVSRWKKVCTKLC